MIEWMIFSLPRKHSLRNIGVMFNAVFDVEDIFNKLDQNVIKKYLEYFT